MPWPATIICCGKDRRFRVVGTRSCIDDAYHSKTSESLELSDVFIRIVRCNSFYAFSTVELSLDDSQFSIELNGLLDQNIEMEGELEQMNVEISGQTLAMTISRVEADGSTTKKPLDLRELFSWESKK